MARLAYFLKTALRGIRRSPLRSLLCAGTMAVALTILGAYLLVYANLESLLAGWGRDLDLSVYLRDEITPAERADLAAYLRGRPEVAEVGYRDRARALARLRDEWPQHGDLLAALDERVVEASLEVRLRSVPDRREALGRLARAAAARPGAAATDYGEEELGRVEGALGLLRSAGAFLAGLLGLAALFVVGANIRLALRDRRDELEIMKLCGATRAFIRAPLYVEGALQGALGGGLAVGLVSLLHGFLESAVAELTGGPAGAVPLAFLSGDLALAIVGGGAALGALGSAIAAGRYLRA